MKKIFAFVTLLLIVVMSYSTVFAQESYLLDFDDSNHNFIKENKEILKDGQKSVEEFYGTGNVSIESIPGVKEYIYLSMTHYYQSGESWSSDIMQTCGYTIGTHGCALTSFTMITDYYSFNDDPGEVNTNLGNYACDFAYSAAGSIYNLSLVGSVHQSVSESYAKDYILGALRNNRPVMVGFDNGSTQHFIVAYGYLEEEYNPSEGVYGNIYYFIHDPASGRDYQYLDDYFENGWNVTRLKVYDN